MCFTTASDTSWQAYVAARRCETNGRRGGPKPRPEVGRSTREDAVRRAKGMTRLTVGHRVRE